MAADPLRELKAAVRVHRRALERVDQTAERRDKAVRAALNAGYRTQIVMELTGVSRSRIDQIAKRTR